MADVWNVSVASVDTSGNLTADGTVTGSSFVGDIAGDVTGDVTGEVTGDVTNVITTYAADTDLSDADFTTSLVEIDGSSASCAITNWTPTVGKTYILFCSDSSNATTVALSSGITWNGTNTTATFDAANEVLTVVCVSATQLQVVANPNSVAFSGT